jgi:hypothetical protein
MYLNPSSKPFTKSMLTTRENTVTTFSSIGKNNAPLQSSASLSTHIHHLGEIIIRK